MLDIHSKRNFRHLQKFNFKNRRQIILNAIVKWCGITIKVQTSKFTIQAIEHIQGFFPYLSIIFYLNINDLMNYLEFIQALMLFCGFPMMKKQNKSLKIPVKIIFVAFSSTYPKMLFGDPLFSQNIICRLNTFVLLGNICK